MRCWAWCWLVCVSLTSVAADTDVWPTLIAHLNKAHIPLENVALVVQAVDGGPALISHNAQLAMHPASVMKVVTSYAALQALGPAYRWKTEVYQQGRLNDGVLEGDLILKGGGDPALDIPAFWQLLQDIQQQGIRHLHGQLRLDTSMYAAAVSQRPVLDDAPLRAYNANPSALLLNGRSTSFRFSLQSTTPTPTVQIQQAWPLPQIQIINQLEVVAGACVDWKASLQYQVRPSADGVTVTFSGRYPMQCDTPRYLELSVLSEAHYMAFTFRQLWQSLGGTWTGKVVMQPTPPDATHVTTWWSPPLDQVLRDINKWSNNVMARQVMLTLGAELGKLPVDETTAKQALVDALRKQGLVFPELVLENGAGLSRIERISAQHLADLLLRAYQQPIMPVLMASLPLLGVDGTTQKRLISQAGHAYLKTGSLAGVSSLAGYVQNQRGQRYVFVMLVNHPNAAASRASQDAVLSSLIGTP